jgi:small-conductance mechanosensitive channel
MSFPISYKDDWRKVEQVLLEVADDRTTKISELSEPALRELEERYAMARADMKPKVYVRLTDNWVELTPRFVVEDHGVRDVKDAMSRDILDRLNAMKIGIASTTFEIVGLPPVRIERAPAHQGA